MVAKLLDISGCERWVFSIAEGSGVPRIAWTKAVPAEARMEDSAVDVPCSSKAGKPPPLVFRKLPGAPPATSFTVPVPSPYIPASTPSIPDLDAAFTITLSAAYPSYVYSSGCRSGATDSRSPSAKALVAWMSIASEVKLAPSSEAASRDELFSNSGLISEPPFIREPECKPIRKAAPARRTRSRSSSLATLDLEALRNNMLARASSAAAFDVLTGSGIPAAEPLARRRACSTCNAFCRSISTERRSSTSAAPADTSLPAGKTAKREIGASKMP
mmetsp:Transcript_13517/g.41036  ORF Transcript_13517/g.41036 Transcript_13517/m.41036 type:complete len:274 (+) Transcript_13517:4725-5546(+)|eukprot:scaffold320293_cov30-Tisochrysis_lutea.AAC.2